MFNSALLVHTHIYTSVPHVNTALLQQSQELGKAHAPPGMQPTRLDLSQAASQLMRCSAAQASGAVRGVVWQACVLACSCARVCACVLLCVVLY